MSRPRHFNLLARLLHWSMAAAILAMLFIGAAMVVSLRHRDQLLALHRPLGIAILLLAIVRLINRLTRPTPALPADLPPIQQFAAHASHWLLYGLMLAMPLIGWAMLSAARYPVVLYGAIELPPIMPQNDQLYTVLRDAHTVLAVTLFVVFLTHFAAALMHRLVFRDGVFESMASPRAGRGD